MKKIIAAICAVVLLISSVSVSAFALTKEDAGAEIAAQKELFESVFGRKITPADARDVLLTSAGLASQNEDSELYDIDGDGKITAIDARIYLRISAKLDSLNNYYDSVKYDYFLALINSIKPNSYNYYRSKISTTEKVNITDSKDVFEDMERQLNNVADFGKLVGVDMGVGFDIESELMSAQGDRNRTNGSGRITNTSYPVIDNELACLVAIDDIAGIEYKTNQTKTFTMYNRELTEVDYAETITGLDSLTIYLKADKSAALNGNLDNVFDNLIAGKALDILTKDEISQISNSLKYEEEGMEDLGDFEIKIIPNNLLYSDCYVTVYFYPETGLPVVTEHYLNYDIDLTMDMLIDFDPDTLLENSGVDLEVLAWALEALLYKNGGKILSVDGDVSIKNTMNEKDVYYLYKNNPNYTDYNDYVG